VAIGSRRNQQGTATKTQGSAGIQQLIMLVAKGISKERKLGYREFAS
jgi:hypothetical protein